METRTARIPRDVYDSINNERRPGQSFAGALAERLAPVPWCIECGVQTACDADRCCVSCGRDLVLLADANAAEVLRGLVDEIAR